MFKCPIAKLGYRMLTSLLTFDLEVFFNGLIVLQDLLLFVNVSVFLNSEFVELLLLFTLIKFIVYLLTG